MNKFVAIALFALVAVVALVSASGYGQSGYGSNAGYGHSAPSYGQNYERKTGFKTVIYHPYGGVSNRFDYRTYPAYGGGYGSGYSHPAPYIKTGLEYSIGDQGYGGNSYGSSY